MSTQNLDNPFQSPATISRDDDVKLRQDQQQQDDLGVAIAKAAIRWSLICGISAIPSFVIAAGTTPAVASGMATGVIIFVIGYTVFDVWTRKHPLRQKPEVKTTLAITYGTRIAISILFPVGFFADLYCGVLALRTTGLFFEPGSVEGPGMGFMPTLVTTLIQGCLLNCVLAGYGVIVFALCQAVRVSRQTRTS